MKRTIRLFTHFIIWVPVLFAIPVLALHSEIVLAALAGHLPLSEFLKAIGGQNVPLYVVFALGAGFIAAHRTAGLFTFGAAYEEAAKRQKESGVQPQFWDDKPMEAPKVMHISSHTGEMSEHGGFDREGNLY